MLSGQSSTHMLTPPLKVYTNHGSRKSEKHASSSQRGTRLPCGICGLGFVRQCYFFSSFFRSICIFFTHIRHKITNLDSDFFYFFFTSKNFFWMISAISFSFEQKLIIYRFSNLIFSYQRIALIVKSPT